MEGSKEFRLEGEEVNQWNTLMGKLARNYIHLKEEYNLLVWSSKFLGKYSTSLGYKDMSLEGVPTECWSWKPLLKLKDPLKSRLFLWLAISDKVLTWDNFQNSTWQ
jgi:hypothetical protein